SVATPNPVRRRLAGCLLVSENLRRAATLRQTNKKPCLPWRPLRLRESLFLSRRHNAATPTGSIPGSRQVVSRVWTTGGRSVHPSRRRLDGGSRRAACSGDRAPTVRRTPSGRNSRSRGLASAVATLLLSS